MIKVICVGVGLVIGGIVGVALMCVFQINTINRYERKIMQLEKELEVYKG